ncbi:MAG: cytochrome c4 [Betaproteobacteria bacterium]|nr:cytochrome c4 [Betaproteobacteria bacterium]MDE2057023.1 cytochrome c4 [Betaproteobacteria bacterium]
MKTITKIISLSAMALALASCADLGSNPVHSAERSRDLANPDVTGVTYAQQVCSTCHGLNGQSINPTFPNLAHQTKEYIAVELHELKEETRLDPKAQQFMWGVARNLTDKQIDQLADYYSKQPAPVNTNYADPKLVAEGKKIWEEGNLSQGVPACSGCHGANAEGAANIPRLAGQHKDYIYKQLVVFNDDYELVNDHKDIQSNMELPGTQENGQPWRAGNNGAVMELMAHGLNDEQKHAVANYLQTVR